MKFRRILAVLLAVVMLLGTMPTASAYIYSCTDQGLSHKWGRWMNNNASCDEVGYRWRICSACGATEEYTYYPDHTYGWSAYDPYSKPTCTEYGIINYYCAVCGECYDEDEAEPLGHDWGSWKMIDDANCQQRGRERRTCKRCGETEYRTGSYGPHDWGEKKTVTTATCIQRGEYEQTCKVCGKAERTPTDYGSHNWGSWQLVEEGTCVKPGKEQRTCSLCGQVQSRDSEDGGHKWGSWHTKREATCTEDGREERKCSLCGKTQTRENDRLGHKWGKWTIVQEAMEGQVGIRERKCGRCGLTEREYFYPDGTIKNGDRDSEKVKEFQEELNNQGYNTGTPDGDFGPNTENAWSQWQEDHGYTADGIGWPGQVDELLNGGDEPEGGDNYIWFVKSIENPPANGSYYVLDEVIKYKMTVGNYTADDLTQISVFDVMNGEGESKLVGSCNLLGVGEEYECFFDYTVVSGDIERGSIRNEAELVCFVNMLGEYKYDYDEVEVKTGGEKKDYKTAISLDLLTDTSSMSANLGDTVSVDLKVTNTGETTVSLYSYSITDGDGKYGVPGVFHDWHETVKDPIAWFFQPGESLTSAYDIVVTEDDVAKGEIIRVFKQNALEWYYSNGEVARPGYVYQDESLEEMYTIDENPTTAQVEIRIPLGNNSSTIGPAGAAIETEFVGDYSSVSGRAGDLIAAQVKVTNTGIVPLKLTGSACFNGSGNYCFAELSSIYWLIDGRTDDPMNNLQPGKSVTCKLEILVTDEDVANGEIIREFEQMAEAAGDYPGGVSDSDTVRLAVAPEEKVSIRKRVLSVPQNGQFFQEGEQVEYEIQVVNGASYAIGDVEIYDPLKGSNEDAMVDFVPELPAGGTVKAGYTHTVTSDDIARGYITNQASGRWYDPDKDQYGEGVSDVVVVYTQDKSSQNASEPTVSITKAITSTPQKENYYLQTESISYRLDVTNMSADAILTDLSIADPLYPGGFRVDKLEPGESQTFYYDYQVTWEDATAGFVENQAQLTYHYDVNGPKSGQAYSNKVTAPTGLLWISIEGFDTAIGGIGLVKLVTSTPANGMFYVPGETVTFHVDITNHDKINTLLNLAVDDPMMAEYEGVFKAMAIDPGVTLGFSFDYVVSPMDAIAGSISNVATGVAFDGDGNRYANVSNTVTVPTGMEGDFPFGVITEMTIVKEETSTPVNGKYYTEGETISYLITYTNTGETSFGETIIYDTLQSGSGEIASAEMLHPGESRTCTFDYVVTAQDVKYGYVANAAVAEYDIGSGYIHSAVSNIVVSDTDGNPNTTYVPGGTIDWDEIRGEEGRTDENGNYIPAINADTCYLRVVSHDGDSVEYEVHFCTKHAKTHNTILTMLNGADDPAKQQMAWNYAFVVWQKEIDAMYNKLLPACDPAAKITVMNERISHLAMIANTQFAMQIADPAKHVETAEAIANLWQNQCIDLCYFMNTAPAERVDSIFAMNRLKNTAELAESCSCVVSEETADRIAFADQYCAVHGLTYSMAELLLLNDNSAQTWEMVRKLWEVELQAAYNRLYAAASEEGGMAFLAEYAAYLKWAAAQEEFLKMGYRGMEETILEAVSNNVMDRTMDACERLK